MTIDEAIDYVDDINSTVSFTKEQKKDEEFFDNVADWLEELKAFRISAENQKEWDTTWLQ